jgi:hypothetical protein
LPQEHVLKSDIYLSAETEEIIQRQPFFLIVSGNQITTARKHINRAQITPDSGSVHSSEKKQEEEENTGKVKKVSPCKRPRITGDKR